jgi:hypothetical protein
VRTEPSAAAARLRGTAAGLLTAALAVAAHGAAGSGAPTGAAVVLLALLAATVGGLAATIPRAADVRVLLALLVGGQTAGHVIQSVAGHSHGGAAAAGAAMLVAHAMAVGAGAILIAAGDRLCRAVSRAVEVAVRVAVAPVACRPAVVTTGADQPLRSALLLAASVSHRGPPVGCAR